MQLYLPVVISKISHNQSYFAKYNPKIILIVKTIFVILDNLITTLNSKSYTSIFKLGGAVA